MSTLPGMLPIPDAAWLLGIPPTTLYERVKAGTDGYGGRYDGKKPRVQAKPVLEASGLDRAEAAQILEERRQELQHQKNPQGAAA